jgi:hypothetical protein
MKLGFGRNEWQYVITVGGMILLGIGLLFVFPYSPKAADVAVKDMTADTTPLSTDILYEVKDPAGSPLDRKITLGTLKTFMSDTPTLATPVIGVATGTSLALTGVLTGKINVITADITLDATQVLGHVIVMSGGAETATLPAAVVGMNVLFYASVAGVKNIDPNGTNTIVLTTAALAAGYQIKSPGAVGDFIAMVCLTANQWTCMGRSGTWVTHGAD